MQFDCIFFVLSLQLMKFAIHIFTIYILSLSIVPCGDGGNGIVEIAKHFFGVEHQHISDHDQDSNGCGGDICSPFCVCNCCSITLDIPTQPIFLVKNLLPISTKIFTFFSNFISFSFHHSIWQPPKFN